ncbi:MAG: class I SAM-dependent methyltransferase [Chloroflexi bacterium]|nr:class I SAM-dependent methyltransferase [Chloroflexota bacterium]
MLKMYGDLAHWWPLLSPPVDYAEEVAFFLQVLVDAKIPVFGSMLELGSGGGNNALHLKNHFSPVTLTDFSEEMLAVSQLLNPDCEHIQGDMRTLRLGRKFDFVFVHDAIDYMTTHADLASAIKTAAVHCKPNRTALFVPDYVRESFEPATEHGGEDGKDRAMRFMEWTYDPDPSDNTYITEYVYVLREGDEPVRIEHDRHICGLFSRADWLGHLRDAGFNARVLHDPFGREVFLSVLQ